MAFSIEWLDVAAIPLTLTEKEKKASKFRSRQEVLHIFVFIKKKFRILINSFGKISHFKN